MKNFIQPGNTVTIPAPDNVASGAGIVIGGLFGIASTDAVAGEDMALAVAGVFALPKEATTDAFGIGDYVKWDATNDRVTTATATTRHGVVVANATATAQTVHVRLAG